MVAMLGSIVWLGLAAQVQSSPLLLYVTLDHPRQFSKLRAGDDIAGTLSRPVYGSDRQIFEKGSRVRLVVDRLEQRPKEREADDRPFAIRLFARRHRTTPVFRQVYVTRPDGSEAITDAAFIKLIRRVEIRPGGKKARGAAETALILSASSPPAGVEHPAGPIALAAGTRARVILMQDLSASKNRRGDRFEVRLAEPLRNGQTLVLPAGSIIEGLVTKRIPPRRLGRPGTLALSFTKLILPGESAIPVSASLAAVEADQSSKMTMDQEAALHGGGPGIARMLIETGVTAGIAKITDDSMQLLLELLISTATDASTAGTGRIVAACTSGIFMLTRHGRDVILPRYVQMELTFNRPISSGN